MSLPRFAKEQVLEKITIQQLIKLKILLLIVNNL